MPLNPYVQTGKISALKVMIPGVNEILIDEAGSHAILLKNGVRMVEAASDQTNVVGFKGWK